MQKFDFKAMALTFFKAVLAGMFIGIGGVASLSSGSKWVGALFFCIGLFAILTFKLNLFTGKVCYVFENRSSYVCSLVVIWLGNFVGATLTGLSLNLTRLTSLKEACSLLIQTKLDDSLISLFILAIFCNVLIFLAVEGFNNFDSPLVRVLALLFGVSVFVLCGFEHCVADMFYFAFSEVFSFNMFLRLFVVTIGNIVGGVGAWWALKKFG